MLQSYMVKVLSRTIRHKAVTLTQDSNACPVGLGHKEIKRM